MDPAQLPQRIELELSDAVIEVIARQAQQANRTFSDLVQHLLAQSA